MHMNCQKVSKKRKLTITVKNINPKLSLFVNEEILFVVTYVYTICCEKSEKQIKRKKKRKEERKKDIKKERKKVAKKEREERTKREKKNERQKK